MFRESSQKGPPGPRAELMENKEGASSPPRQGNSIGGVAKGPTPEVT